MWPELEAFCRESAELEGISWDAWLIKNNEWGESDGDTNHGAGGVRERKDSLSEES
jgi:hypothetical protein